MPTDALPSVSTLIALTLSIAGHCVHPPYPVSVNLEPAVCQLLTLRLMSYVHKCSVRDLYSETAPEKVWIQVRMFMDIAALFRE